MKKHSIFRLILVFTLVFSGSSVLVFAQEADESRQDAIDRSQRYYDVKQDLNDKQNELDRILVNESLLEERLSEVSEEAETLEGQLSIIDERLFSTQTKIKAYQAEIDKNTEDIRLLEEEVLALEEEITTQKDKFKELLTVLYFEGASAGFFDESELQAIKLLMNNEEATAVIQRSANLSLVEFALEDLLVEMQNNQEKLLDDMQSIQDKNIELEAFRSGLAKEQTQLVLQKEAKEQVLNTTRGEESIYRELLKQAKEEQVRIRRDINNLINEYAKYKDLLDEEGFAEDDFGFGDNSDKLSWPIVPSLGISAYFRDPSYKAALGVEHNAVDIPAYQRTEVHAAADGVVLKVKGGEGLDYHYLIIGHNGNIMTLYGHMNEILVVEGQRVKRGSIIGLSGGMPGTRGAGWLTTGPHLHFEVFLNGVHVDPMPYLDASVIDKRYLPGS